WADPAETRRVDASAGSAAADSARLAAASVMLSKRFAVGPVIGASSPSESPSALTISEGRRRGVSRFTCENFLEAAPGRVDFGRATPRAINIEAKNHCHFNGKIVVPGRPLGRARKP